MASAVYTEPPASRLSISLEGSASASPFPSPSSSFLPPPTPGAHEFAVKPAPPARTGGAGGRKSSNPQLSPQRESDSHNTNSSSYVNGDPSSQSDCDGNEPSSVTTTTTTKSRPNSSQLQQQQRTSLNGLQVPHSSGASHHSASSSTSSLPASPALVSPVTPTPSSILRQPSPPPITEGSSAAMLDLPRSPAPAPHERDHSSASSTTTPTKQSSSLPPTDTNSQPTTSTSNTTSSTAGAAAEPPLSNIIIPDLDQSNVIADGPSSPPFSATSRPLSSALSSISTHADPSLFSNRPAPPSPISRRVSKAYSTSSVRSRSSRPPSTSVSRANSMRKNTNTSAKDSPVIHPSPTPHRQSIGSQLAQGGLFPPLPSPQNLTFGLNATSTSTSTPTPSTSSISPPVSAAATAGSGNSLPTTPATATPSSSLLSQSQSQSQTQQKRASTATSTQGEVYIKIRDFGFPPSDERHLGLGPDVPKPNKVVRLNRRLGPRTLSQMSVESRDGYDQEEDEEEDGMQLGGFIMGLGRIGMWGTGAGGSGETAADVMERESRGGAYPSRSEMDINFLNGEESEGGDGDFYDAEEGEEMDQGEEEEEDTLYPGLYRALYAFEPEGTAEMRLEEDQLVRVVGRGGGVGWAVVIDEKGTSESVANGGAGPKHALVPESYLEPVRLDWEDEEEGADAGVHVAA